MIPHFLVDPGQISAQHAVLGDEDTRHLTAVLRARAGDEMTVADGEGTIYAARFDRVRDGLDSLALIEHDLAALAVHRDDALHAELGQPLDDAVELALLGQCVDHRDRRSLRRLIARGAEYDHGQAVARWRSIAVAAAKQSRASRVPRVTEVGDWREAFAEGLPGVVCWEESATGFRAALDRVPAADRLVIGIGPEGGLTHEEVEATGLAHGSLGPTVLRTETAALVAVAALRFHYGLMENPDT